MMNTTSALTAPTYVSFSSLHIFLSLYLLTAADAVVVVVFSSSLTVILSLSVCSCLFHFAVSFVHLLGRNNFFSICSSLNVPTVNNIIQCVSADGQIGFVHNTDVEPLHIVSITKPLTNSATTTSTHSSMSNFFHRKTGLINIDSIEYI